ncbi:MAG: hypothetical protein AUG89_02590 [Acidobacteria bacterium 13_1_20CM_4_56_7]|nr:MAG: hypothetical protein AUG89_02590 [Acidobacteria bacterium 13_1_20CM_4_56_7]
MNFGSVVGTIPLEAGNRVGALKSTRTKPRRAARDLLTEGRQADRARVTDEGRRIIAKHNSLNRLHPLMAMDFGLPDELATGI